MPELVRHPDEDQLDEADGQRGSGWVTGVLAPPDRTRHGGSDPLLAALIGKLPPTDVPFPATPRRKWLDMMAMAFDVVYGAVVLPDPAGLAAGYEEARQLGAVGTSGHLHAAPHSSTVPSGASQPVPPHGGSSIQSAIGGAPPAAPRQAHAGHDFYIALDGTACNANGAPVMITDIAPGEIIFDYRAVIGDFRDTDSIVWADGKRGTAYLPSGVSFCGPG